MDVSGNLFHQRMDELNYMLQDLDVPNDLRRECRMYFHQARRLQVFCV